MMTTDKAPLFRFVLLGDLHFDRLEHHDMAWLAREKPNDVRQVQNYSRITREVMPALFREVREQIRAGKGMAFAAHIGDLVEGLCGTPPLARRHCQDAVRFVRDAGLGVPFLFAKGNHDITGPGAVEAFDEVLLPFLGEQARTKLASASFAARQGDALFAYFDAYNPDSLPWLEQTLAKRAERRLFVLIHPPVVPYGARSLWHLYARPEEQKERKRLLNLLGKHRAIVLCGHLHKNGVVVRDTEQGPFVQLAVNSVLPSADSKPKDEVRGVKSYGPDLVRLEPKFQPETEPARREALKAEAPFIRHYEYADAPGYAVVTVQGDAVRADLYAGLGRRLWKTIPLSDLLSGKSPVK
jgi:hypothetical protein